MNEIGKLHRALALSAVLYLICSISGAQAVLAGDTSGADAVLQQRLQDVEKAQAGGSRVQLADDLYNLSAAYLNCQRYDEAEDAMERSLNIERTLNRGTRTQSSIIVESLPPLVETMAQMATIFVLQNKIDRALEQYKEAISLAKNNGGSKQDVAVLEGDVASTLVKTGKCDEAESMLHEAISSLGNDDDSLSATKANLLRILSASQSRRAKYKDALDSMEQACDLLEKKGDQADAGKALCILAQLQNKAGMQDEAMQTYARIQKEFPAQLFSDILGEAELCAGDACYSQHQNDLAMEHYQLASKLAAEDKNSPELVLKATTALGMLAADRQDFQAAEKSHYDAWQTAQRLKLTDRATNAALELAQDYLMEGAPEKALNTLNEVSTGVDATARSLHSRGEIDVGLAKCYKELGQWEKAVHLTQEAVKNFHQVNDPSFEANALNVLGTIYLDYRALDRFDELVSESMNLYAGLNDPRDRARLDYNKAQAKMLAGKYAEAVLILEETLSRVANSHDNDLKSGIYRGLGLSYFEQGEYQKSLDAFNQSLALVKDGGSFDAQWSCNLGLGKALKQLKQYDQAKAVLEAAIQMVEEERSHLTRDAFKTHTLDFRRDCFYELVDLYYLTGQPYKALEIAERGKSRAFLDMLANHSERRSARTASAVPGPGPGPSPSSGQQITLAAGEKGDRSVSMTSKDVDDPIQETAISPVSVKAPDEAELRALVKKHGTTCVEYLRFGNKIYTWVIQPDGSITMPEPITAGPEIKELTQEISSGIVQKAATMAAQAKANLERQQKLQRLYTLLIAPLEPLLPKDKDAVVTIIADDYLFSVPFAALVDRDKRFLIEKHTLSYAPALGVLRATQELAQQSQNLPHKLLAFGNPITKRIAFLGELPHAESEVVAIQKLFGTDASCSMLLIKDLATRRAFIEKAPLYTEIHLATHGLLDEEHPMRSALVLAPEGNDDGLLTAHDIIFMNNLKLHLVVLSACETGKGQITGDGVIGLSRAFIIAGAPSILVSQWNVDDVWTEYQMKRFYAAYLQGKDKARSLRDAQLATIQVMEDNPDGKNDPNKPRANPRYWAAFQLVGENQ
jgi:CHAT domain-containing protein/tetratricopeptide (TPR) repeat protein